MQRRSIGCSRADKVLVLHQKIYDKSIKWAGSPDRIEILYNLWGSTCLERPSLGPRIDHRLC